MRLDDADIDFFADLHSIPNDSRFPGFHLEPTAFDSQNVPFWSAQEQQYLCYFRIFKDGFRRIARTTSPDFEKWTEPVLMEYGDRPVEHLYTNQTHPYFRAPHIYLAVAARFFPGRKFKP